MGSLTALRIKSLKEPGRYPDGDGLFLIVKASGASSWMLRIQMNGRRRDIGLGSLKTVGLADAREQAAEMRRQARKGIDPLEARRAATRAAAVVPTFGKAAEELHRESKAGWRNGKHRDQWLTTLKAYAFPSMKDIPVDKIDAGHVIAAVQPIWLTKPETARRVKQRIIAVLDWAHSRGYRPMEAPARAIGKGLKAQPKKDGHFAALPYPMAPALFSTISNSDTVGRLALRFLMLTAARSGEVRGATWDEIDLAERVWKVPADRMKAGKAHVVPLCDEALRVLEIAQKLRKDNSSGYVFPGLREKALSDMTLSKVLKEHVTVPATVHGMRSAFRDWVAEKTSYSGEVAEAALAHTIQNRVEAAYRRTNYLEIRRRMMADWASFLRDTGSG